MNFLKYIRTILVAFFLGATGFSANQIEFGEGKGVVKGAGRHVNWVEVTDVTNKVLAKKPHVLTVENLSSTRNYNGSILEGFTGCHSEKALSDYVAANGGSYQIVGKPNNLLDDVVFEGQPVISLNGKNYVKTNGGIVEYAPGKYGGASSFFPKSWSEAKILDEVEYAIANNHGKVNQSYGFGK